MSAIDWNELDGYEALVSELRANPPAAPERLRQRILEGAPVARRRTSSKRRLVLVVVPVAVTLAVGAALVHGLVNPGSKESGAVPGQLGLLGPARTTPTADSGKSVHRTFARPRPGKPALNGPIVKAYMPSHLNALAIPKDRLVHADASLQVQVPNRSALSEATNKATQIVSSLGGYAQSVQYQSERKGSGSAFLTLRVPVDRAQTAIARLGQLGKLLSQQVSTQDLQQQLTRQTNQIGSLRRAIAVYQQALKSGTLSAPERVEIQIKLANAQHSLRLVRKARSGTVASGATADISLTLSTHNAGAVGGGNGGGRFGRLLGSAAGFLALEGIVVLYALVVLSPILLIGGLAWWLLRERRRREETRLLASA
ncbi:MAG TPA: DUF4349 domain-containing protein [Gaiellaceae bacterium]|nr:DUF4349 domain-containing protein [Gaiellaceae bacterium]